jgi:hypothetical protein
MKPPLIFNILSDRDNGKNAYECCRLLQFRLSDFSGDDMLVQGGHSYGTGEEEATHRCRLG